MIRARAASLLLALAALAAPLAAQAPDQARIAAIASIRSASGPAPSPDGRSFAFISNAS